MTPELIAILAVGLALGAFNWRAFGRLEDQISEIRKDNARWAERTSRLEGLYEGFTGRSGE